MWDIEGEVLDTKPFEYDDRERGRLAPGQSVHRILARLTVDNDLRVLEAHASMADVPFRYCIGGAAGITDLVGATLGKGWRRAVDAQLLGERGCSHLRELLYAMATVAFQTISAYREQFMPELGVPADAVSGEPFFVGKCHAWANDGPVVESYFPRWFRSE